MTVPSLKLSRILAIVLLAVFGAGCSGASETDSVTGEPRRVIVDTDMGVDDVRALMFLIEHPAIEVVAISVTGTGLGRCPASGHSAVALLDALDAPDVPVGCGDNAPSEGFNTFPSAWRNSAVALVGMDLQPAETDLPDAVQVMNDVLESSDEPVTLLTLGPLTNVAQLLDGAAPVDKLDEVRIMGGAVDVGGNIISFDNFVAEFNIWIDPVAADRVFQSDLPITLVPLDATNDVPLTPGFGAALDAGPATAASTRLAANLDAGGPLSGLYHWDDLAAVTLVDESVVEFETLGVSVDTDLGGRATGRTERTEGGTSMRVAVGADRSRFEELFFETITGEATTTEGLWEPASLITFDGTTCSYVGPDPLGPEMSARVANTSDQPGLGVVFGTYAEDATAEDIQTMIDGGFSAPPVFFDVHTLASLPANTVSFVEAVGIPEATTIWCAANDDVIELAGPKLRTP